MIERNERVETAPGTMDVFITRPEGPGPFPLVVELMDALGMREELYQHARRVARWGYCVLVPDLFHRAGLKGPLDLTRPDTLTQIRAAMAALSDALVTRDLEAALALAAADPAADLARIGLYGFCMGGRLALTLAQHFGARVAACASVHPGGLVSEEPGSPHRHLDQIAAELYFGIADQDAHATRAQMDTLEHALQARQIAYQLEFHPGALHGFMMPSRKDVYREATAEQVWGRIEALLARTLGPQCA
ncbi:MAG: dienelactone hydrolase family protein [Steroidobacteraceae bacterium]